jgi:NAD(P)-dependent dehydrogenase (short-subunit alcohol dehydrogenase family)
MPDQEVKSRSSGEAKVQGAPANKFYDDWIAEHVKPGSASGKVAIVTGSNSGTGFWCANALAQAGATVILACRNLDKANLAKQEILERFPSAKIEVMKLDTSSLKTVKEFAAAFQKKFKRLDLLVNNAGVMGIDYSTTEDGFEIQWQTNHLGHFLLTKLLMPTIEATPGTSRIIQHSSGAHSSGSPKFTKENMEVPGHAWTTWHVWNILAPLMFAKGTLAPLWSFQIVKCLVHEGIGPTIGIC